MPTPFQAQESTIYTPFHIDNIGSVAFVTQADKLAVQEIEAVLLTQLGERVMRPELGCPVSTSLFSNIPAPDSTVVINELYDALINTCRYSTIMNVLVDTTELGALKITVEYIPLSFNVILSTVIPFSTIFSRG